MSREAKMVVERLALKIHQPKRKLARKWAGMQHTVCQVGCALIFKAMPPPGPAETTRRAKSDGSTEGQAVEMRQDPPEVVHSGLEETALHRGVVLRAVRSSKPPKRPLLGLQHLGYVSITEAKKQPLKILVWG